MLNWLTRYALATPLLHFDDGGKLVESVLDVGCGPHGLACAVEDAEFVGLDVQFPAPVAPGMIAFRNPPGPLPFADGAFDTVICLDVLEHIPREERSPFVEELSRVAARRVIVACPSNDGAWGQEILRRSYAQRGIPTPPWLDEHDEHGLPSPEEIRAACARPDGFRARELPMTNGMLATMMVIADMLPEFAAHAAREYKSERERWLRTFESARFGHSTRRGYVIERESPAPAVVDAGLMRETLWAAVRCPACGHSGLCRPEAAAATSALLCPVCEQSVTRDAMGAFDLRIASPAAARVPAASPPSPSASPAATPAPVPSAIARVPPAPLSATNGGDLAPIRASGSMRLLLTPDWEQPREWLPAVATFVAGGPADGCALCVDATTTSLGLATVHEMLARVCDAVAGDAPFGELVILDEPFVRDGTVDVSHAADVRRHLGISEQVPRSAADAIARAQAAKRLADEVLTIAHRRRFLDAPDPWTSREPLVTVRIATWRKPQLLTERAIPSVLNGIYRNVELLVCSDGPDPDTAAAVARIRDPRLRYMEMPERPVYPEQRWSLWEVAGSYAANRMVSECRGSFIAPLCHDDAFTDDHLTVLLSSMAESRADFAYGQALMEKPEGPWYTLGRAPLEHGYVTHGACLYSGRLRHMPLDPDCWVLREPGDWNLIRRVTSIGAKPCFVPRVVLTHFAERSVVGYDNADVRDDETFAADLARTGLSWLLETPVPSLPVASL